MRIFIFVLINLFWCEEVIADSTISVSPRLTLSAYIEVYYGYDFGKPSSHERPSFVYNYSRHNEFNLNLGFVKAAITDDRLRANLAVMAGTYAQYNLASEQSLLKNIYEANAGIKLLSKSNLWLDAGILSSHIGFESAVSKKCWTLTRSLMAENTPYYESGAKLSYTTNNEKWTFAGFVLNGWQRIQRINGNNTPAFGTQIVYQPSANITFNSSSFIGNDKPDSVKQMRYFHNLYGILKLSERFGVIVAFDTGIEQANKGSENYNAWYSPNLIIRYRFVKKLGVAFRGEYYNDKKEVIITTGTPNGFQTFGCSMNLDYLPTENVLIRLEGKMFNSKDKVFMLREQPDHNNYFIVSSIAVSF